MIWFLLIPVALCWLLWNHFSVCNPHPDPYEIVGCWPHGIAEWLLAGVFVFLAVIITAVISYAIARAIGALVISRLRVWTWHERYRESLVAMRAKYGTQGEVGGGLFLMAGYVESSPYYFYYKRAKDGALKPDRVQANDSVSIYEEDRPDGELVASEQTAPTWCWVLGIMDDSAWRYAIHVPKDSVRREFSM